MSRFARSDFAVGALVVAALVFGTLGFAGFGDEVSDSLLFIAWLLTLLTLFVLAIRVPQRGSGSRASAWVVCHERRLSTTVRNYMRDEGGPFEVGNQVLISSHRKLLSSKAMVVSVAEAPGQDSGRQG